jgi:hypothetical protein
LVAFLVNFASQRECIIARCVHTLQCMLARDCPRYTHAFVRPRAVTIDFNLRHYVTTGRLQNGWDDPWAKMFQAKYMHAWYKYTMYMYYAMVLHNTFYLPVQQVMAVC